MLLTRKQFTESVIARDRVCVVCQKSGPLDAHHLLERKLWSDGGYYLTNGVSLCQEHHMMAEQTFLTVEELRRLAGISEIVLPEGFDPNLKYDKWGAIIRDNLHRTPGPLHEDTGAQRAYGRLIWELIWQ